jgi:hypothetical protein
LNGGFETMRSAFAIMPGGVVSASPEAKAFAPATRQASWTSGRMSVAAIRALGKTLRAAFTKGPPPAVGSRMSGA